MHESDKVSEDGKTPTHFFGTFGPDEFSLVNTEENKKVRSSEAEEHIGSVNDPHSAQFNGVETNSTVERLSRFNQHCTLLQCNW